MYRLAGLRACIPLAAKSSNARRSPGSLRSSRPIICCTACSSATRSRSRRWPGTTCTPASRAREVATGQREPNSARIRAGKINIGHHLQYISWLVERRRWLAGEHFSLADVSAAAHLSALDYLGDVPWDQHEPANEWYARVKSRPSFRGILSDHIPGAPPPSHYADLDF